MCRAPTKAVLFDFVLSLAAGGLPLSFSRLPSPSLGLHSKTSPGIVVGKQLCTKRSAVSCRWGLASCKLLQFIPRNLLLHVPLLRKCHYCGVKYTGGVGDVHMSERKPTHPFRQDDIDLLAAELLSPSSVSSMLRLR